MKSILIIISTYNGARYLREQLDSIFNQTYSNFHIFVRDDGSNDDTIKILEEYKNRGLTYYLGDNKKPALSFLEAISVANKDYDYYAFCDQDDVWNPDKVEAAIRAISEIEQDLPILYYSATELVDASLNHIGTNFRLPIYTNNLCTSLLNGSLVTGCTMVINKSLANIIRIGIPQKPLMHDSWIHRVCLSVGGRIIADPIPHVKYRQHNNNVLGIHKISFIKKIKKSFKRNTIHRENAKEILHFYANTISLNNKKILNSFVEYDRNIISFFQLLFIVITNKSDFRTKTIAIVKIITFRY